MEKESFNEKCMSVAFTIVLAAFAFVLCCGGIAILSESGLLTKHRAEVEAAR